MCFLSVILIIKNYSKDKIIKTLKNPSIIFLSLCFLGGFILSLGTSIKLGPKVLVNIEYPNFIEHLIGAFRASGRFVWIPCYLIFFASIYIVNKYVESKKTANFIIILCLVIQLLDLRAVITNKFNYEGRKDTFDNAAWQAVLEDYKHVFYIRSSDFSSEELMELAYIANENGCTVSNFYFARPIKGVEETQNENLEKLTKSQIEDKCVYVLKKEQIDLLEKTNLYCYNIENYIVVVQNEIKELERQKL